LLNEYSNRDDYYYYKLPVNIDLLS